MQVLARSTVGLYKNQQALDNSFRSLAASERSLDYQVAVLTRVTIMHLNRVRALVGLDFITEEELESVFEDWNAFIARGDANAHMSHWVLGKPLEDLPPPPEPKEEETPSETPAAQVGTEESAGECQITQPPESAQGATIFGGDYADPAHEEEDPEQVGLSDETPVQDDEVPALRPPDEASDQRGEDSAEVREVSA